MKQLSVFVVGAGPAGSVASALLASAGYQVKLFEKEKLPGNKICGGGLGMRSVRILNELSDHFGHNILQDDQLLSISKANFHFNNKATYSFHFDELSPQKSLYGYTCHRTALDRALLDMAINAGVEYLGDTKVLQAHSYPDKVILQTEKKQYEGDYIIGADGVRSQIAISMQGWKPQMRYNALAIREILQCEDIPFKNAGLSFYYLKDFWPGYFWLFPLPADCVDVGLALPPKLRHLYPDIKSIYHQFVQSNPTLKALIKDATNIAPLQGAYIPLGRKTEKISGQRYLLCGDAASLSDPLMFEGIANALYSGKLAAEFLLQYREKSELPAAGAWDTFAYSKLMSGIKRHHRVNPLLHQAFLFEGALGFMYRHPKIISKLLSKINI